MNMNLYRVKFQLGGQKDSYIVATSFESATAIFKERFNPSATLTGIELVESNVTTEIRS